jgi:16S rRNA (adenine1518-N6/adenine1519-N6)-dimethyltransferase
MSQAAFPAPDKRFGQHFLVNAGIVAKIADAVARACEKHGAEAIEIGPGPGVLTEALLARGLRVQAVELDPRMVEHLQSRFAAEIASGTLRLHPGDALELALEPLAAGLRPGPGQISGRAVVCGNLPYNVGTQIVFRFLEGFAPAPAFVYMLQKEVVQRFAASKGSKDYGIPSIKLASSCRVLETFWVQPGSFLPPPKVVSGVICFERREGALDALERGGEYDRLSEAVRRAFASRRKMLKAAFPSLGELPEAKKRAEELAPEDFLRLLREARLGPS